MMKLKLIVLTILLGTAIVSCKTNNKEPKSIPNTFTIEGEIEGLGNNNLYFRKPNKDYEKLGYWRDSIIVTEGKFSFKDSIDDYQFITFSTNMKELIKSSGRGYYPVKSAYLNVMLYPGANIKVSGKTSDFMDAYPSDGSINDDFAKLHKQVFPKMNESINSLLEANLETDETKKERLKQKSDSVSSIAKNLKKNFIMNNPSSMASLYYLSDMMMRSQISDEDAIVSYKLLDTSFHNISYYKDISKRVKGINATAEGSVAPAIKTTSTLNGEEFDLSSYRGKYVMIDFWGIWCGPCVAEMPKVKEFRELYKDKLEILGVNSGDKKERIIDFISKNGYEWQQILDVKGSEADNFVLKYNVTGFPTKFIIDPEGKIIKKYVGSGEEAFILLEELLK